MSDPLDLYFEPNQPQRQEKFIYHKFATGARTPKFDLFAILGNKDGTFEWGSAGWTLSAKNVTLKGQVLKAELRYKNEKDWTKKQVELNLSQKVRLTADKKALEGYDIPTIDKERMAIIEKAIKEAQQKIKEEAEKADENLKAREKAKEEKAKSDEANKKEIQDDAARDAEAAKLAEEIKLQNKKKEDELAAELAQKQAHLAAHGAKDKAELDEFKHKAEFEAGAYVVKAEKAEAKHVETRQDRHVIEEQLIRTRTQTEEEEASIILRELNLSKTFGDNAWLNAELRERDSTLSEMSKEKFLLDEQLSLSHERFSSLYSERLTMAEEQHRIRSIFASLMNTSKTTDIKIARVDAEVRKQKGELKHTLDETVRFETKHSILEAEIKKLREENRSLKVLTADLKEKRSDYRLKFETAQTTITGQESVIKHSEMWKVLFEQQVEALRKELADVSAVMTRLEQSTQDTTKALRITVTEKEKLAAELREVEFSKTAVQARVVVVEDALKATRLELSQLSRSYDSKDDEVRAMESARAVLQRRLSELSVTHSRERNITKSISQRIVHAQVSMSENIDWMYETREDLSEESKDLYLHYLHHGGAVGLGLQTPPLSRLPSYNSAVNSPSASPARPVFVPTGKTVLKAEPVELPRELLRKEATEEAKIAEKVEIAKVPEVAPVAPGPAPIAAA